MLVLCRDEIPFFPSKSSELWLGVRFRSWGVEFRFRRVILGRIMARSLQTFSPQSSPWIQRQTLNLKTLDPEKNSKPVPEPPQTSWVVLGAGVRGGFGFRV